jgi:hypothetical protein
MEGCESGRIGRSRKPLRAHALRGFKSHSLRGYCSPGCRPPGPSPCAAVATARSVSQTKVLRSHNDGLGRRQEATTGRGYTGPERRWQ